MKERTLQGALTFLGFVISLMAIFYFAVSYWRDISEWTRLAALALLGLAFAFLGVYLRDTFIGQPFFTGHRLSWLRPTNVLYLSALFCGIVDEIVFLNMDQVARPLKVLASLVVGVGLVVAVALRGKDRKAHAEPIDTPNGRGP